MTEVPVEGGTGSAVVFPAASTLREEMAVSGQRLLAASGQIPVAAHTRIARTPEQRIKESAVDPAAAVRIGSDS